MRRGTTLVALLALLTSVLAVPVVAEEGAADLAVMNGEPASIDDLPWVVYLQHPGAGQGSACTGSVIAPSWILTAAHCVEYEDANGTYQRVQPGDVEVFFGMEELDVGPTSRREGATIHIHPEWFSSGRISSDIALIELDQPTDTPPIQLVGADYVEVPGERAVVSGWGLLEEDVETDRLMRGEVPILEDNLCAWTYGFNQYDFDSSICAGGEGTDACSGDSGGPLVLPTGDGFVQIGITAAGDLCTAESRTHGIHTAVGYHRTWVDGLVPDLMPPAELEQPVEPEPEPEPEPLPEPEPVEDPDPELEPEPEPAPDPEPEPVSFSDVPVGHTFEEPIAWLASTGITTGRADGTFGLNADVTRGAVAAFLYRFAGEPEGPFDAPRFSDVPVGHTFEEPIAWLASTGITTGRADGTFGLNADVPRGAVAAFLYRFAGEPEGPFDAPRFSDVPVGHTFEEPIAWLASTGITTGRADGTFGLNAEVTRGAVAAFLYRYDQYQAATPTDPDPAPDIDPAPDPDMAPAPDPAPDTDPAPDPDPAPDTDQAGEVIEATWSTWAVPVLRGGVSGERFTYACPANGTPGQLIGTGLYMDNSTVCAAGVHAGAITLGTGGLVTIENRPPPMDAAGSTRNGVRSTWGYNVTSSREDVRAFVVVVGGSTLEPDPALADIDRMWEASWMTRGTDRAEVGQRLAYVCPPAQGGEGTGEHREVWGTDVYRGESQVCLAAVHAGLIAPAAGGTVVFDALEGQIEYRGSTRNGVTTQNHGAFSSRPSTMRFEFVRSTDSVHWWDPWPTGGVD